MITPAFAEELVHKQGLRHEACTPRYLVHGSGEGVTSAAPAVRCLRADLVLCCKGLTFVRKSVKFYIYQGCLPDVILSSRLLESISCVERPEVKLLDWDVSSEDVGRLAHVIDSAHVQHICAMQFTCNSAVGAKTRPNVQRALQELTEQRERLRARVDMWHEVLRVRPTLPT